MLFPVCPVDEGRGSGTVSVVSQVYHMMRDREVEMKYAVPILFYG